MRISIEGGEFDPGAKAPPFRIQKPLRLVRMRRRIRTGCFSTSQKLRKRPGGMTGRSDSLDVVK